MLIVVVCEYLFGPVSQVFSCTIFLKGKEKRADGAGPIGNFGSIFQCICLIMVYITFNYYTLY